MSKKSEVTWLTNPFPAVDFYYCVCASEKQYKKALNHLKIEDIDRPQFINYGKNATVHTFSKDNSITCVVCINNHEDRDQVTCLLAHEAVHMLRELKELMGEDYSGNEFDAYCVQMMTFEMIKQI